MAPQAHPDRLATVAALHGISAPDPQRARVLELGCGAGGNLLAIAVATPAGRVLGIDRAADRVAEGRRAIEEIGLSNVELRQGDVSAFTGEELGELDYVIAHGLDERVPDAVLSHLAADGLATVSGPERHGFAYVGDGELADLLPGRVPSLPVLCRDSRTPAAEPDAAAMRGLHFAASGEPRQPGAAGTASPDARAERDLLASAVALLRSRAPDTVAFKALRAALGADPDALAGAVLAGFRAELLMPHAAPLRAVAAAGLERPAASPLARWQAQHDLDVTSLAYTSVRMEEPPARLLLTLLDGTRDRATIRAEFAARTGLRLSPEDLEANLTQLGRLFLLY